MASSVPSSVFNLGATFLPPAIQQPLDAPVPGPLLPQLPQWRLGRIPLQDPRELQEEQMGVFNAIISQEISDHNTTRNRLQRYIALFMKHERGHAHERHHVQYLNTVIHNLRTEVQDEKMKRMEAEGAQVLCLQEGMEGFCCELPPMSDVTQGPAVEVQCTPPATPSSPGIHTMTGYTSPSDVIYNQRLEQLAPCADAHGGPQVTLKFPSRGSPEAFALDEKDLEQPDKEKKTWKGGNKRKLCLSTSEEVGISEKPSKRSKR